jgi:phage N-6-adenine-methyltransferase
MSKQDLSLHEGMRDLTQYDPEKGLKTIVMAEASQKHFRRALAKTKDPLARDQLLKAIETKINAQVDYVVWRDGVIEHGGDRKSKSRLQNRNLEPLPESDPGDLVAHRWRKRFCIKRDGRTEPDDGKIAKVKEDVELRCQRICEQQNMGTVRGTEGTGEFERYTPAKYIEAARKVLGGFDLDPASCEFAQRTVQADRYFTAKDDGLKYEWHGRVWLNPPYHRELAPKFIDKLVEEFTAGRTTAAIMLTNNCTDTDWFHAAVHAANAVCFTYGRIKFVDERGEEVLPTQGQAFFYFGPNVDLFELAFCEIGFGVLPIWK